MEYTIEEINIEDLDCNELSNSVEMSDIEELQNTIYSYPYFYKGNIEYQFRLIFKDDYIYLDEIVFNEDETENLEKSIVSETNVFKKPINHVLELMKKNIDIRDEKTILDNEIMELSDKNIDENKKVVLKELYKVVLESIIDENIN